MEPARGGLGGFWVSMTSSEAVHFWLVPTCAAGSSVNRARSFSASVWRVSGSPPAAVNVGWRRGASVVVVGLGPSAPAAACASDLFVPFPDHLGLAGDCCRAHVTWGPVYGGLFCPRGLLEAPGADFLSLLGHNVPPETTFWVAYASLLQKHSLVPERQATMLGLSY